MNGGRTFKLGPKETQAVEWVAERYGLDEYNATAMLIRRGVESLMPNQPPPVPVGTALTPSTAAAQQMALESGEPAQEEIAWRVQECWSSYLEQRRRFSLRRSGRKVSRVPKLTADVRDAIRRVLLEFDRELLEPHLRDQWKAQSVARAAGIGIFLDGWLTGDNDNDKVYAYDAWRPWKKQRGKPWRVQEFADLYFDYLERRGQ